MRKIETLMMNAFNNTADKTSGNDSVSHTETRSTYRLHRTDIVTVDRANGSIVIQTGGWNTPTTRSRLNAFFRSRGINASVFTKKGTQRLSLPCGAEIIWNGAPIDITQTPKPNFTAELTDTFGGEANYSWVKRFNVYTADVDDMADAIRQAKRHFGIGRTKRTIDSGDMVRLDVVGACVCLFVTVNY